jgi:hypothetical protein
VGKIVSFEQKCGGEKVAIVTAKTQDDTNAHHGYN